MERSFQKQIDKIKAKQTLDIENMKNHFASHTFYRGGSVENKKSRNMDTKLNLTEDVECFRRSQQSSKR